jgi:hypothetical protein
MLQGKHVDAQAKASGAIRCLTMSAFTRPGTYRRIVHKWTGVSTRLDEAAAIRILGLIDQGQN